MAGDLLPGFPRLHRLHGFKQSNWDQRFMDPFIGRTCALDADRYAGEADSINTYLKGARHVERAAKVAVAVDTAAGFVGGPVVGTVKRKARNAAVQQLPKAAGVAKKAASRAKEATKSTAARAKQRTKAAALNAKTATTNAAARVRDRAKSAGAKAKETSKKAVDKGKKAYASVKRRLVRKRKKDSPVGRGANKGTDETAEGIYEFVGPSGRKYIGQSGKMPTRLKQHAKSGKLPEGGSVTSREIPGGKTVREIEEQRRIDELGGIGNLENKVNPIGPKRRHLLK